LKAVCEDDPRFSSRFPAPGQKGIDGKHRNGEFAFRPELPGLRLKCRLDSRSVLADCSSLVRICFSGTIEITGHPDGRVLHSAFINGQALVVALKGYFQGEAVGTFLLNYFME
jgi:hypothetical protein